MFSRKAAQALVKGHKEAPVSPLILIKKIMEYEQFAKMRYLFFFSLSFEEQFFGELYKKS